MASWNENSSKDDEVDIYAVNIAPNEVSPGLTCLSLHQQEDDSKATMMDQTLTQIPLIQITKMK